MARLAVVGSWSRAALGALTFLLCGAGAPVSPLPAPSNIYTASTLPSFVNLHFPLVGAPASISTQSPLVWPQRTAPSRLATTAQTTRPSGQDFTTCDAAADVPPQAIYDLAAALKNDPEKIFNFVHDNIDLELGVESSKGALGTYLDRSGNSFDQAALLAALLNAASATNTQISNVQIAIGVETVSAAQFGLSALPAQLLVDAGATQAEASMSQMPYAWVQVTVPGGFHTVMDPSAKTYMVYTGTAGNLSSYQPTSPAQTQAGISNYLQGFASNIYNNPGIWQNSIQSYYTLPLFIGGRRILAGPSIPNYGNTDPNGISLASTQGAAGGSSPNSGPYFYPAGFGQPGMPINYRTLFKVVLPGGGSGGSGTLCMNQLYGHSVLIYDTNFYVDNVNALSGGGSAGTDTFQVIHQVWNSQGTLNNSLWLQTASEPVTSLNGAAIQFGVGRIGAFRAQETARVTEAADMPGGGLTDKDFVSLGSAQLRQTSRGTELLDQLAGTYTINHHTVQFEHYTATTQSISTIGAASLAAVDTPLLATSVDVVTSSPPSGLSVSPNAVAYALSALQSAQEAAALNHANVPQSVSAATLMANAGGQSDPAGLIPVAKNSDPNANSTIHAAYSSTQIATLQAYACTGCQPGSGYDLVVPAAPSSWGSGTNAMAFLASAAGGTSAFVLQTPNGIYKGASSPNPILPGGGSAGIGDEEPESGPRVSGLAVNGQSGVVSFAAPLLSIGSKGSPYSLALSMAYSSNPSMAYSLNPSQQLSYASGNAPGWAHNYNISLKLTSDPSALIGNDLVGPALPGIVSLYYLLQNANQLAAYYAGSGGYPTSAVFDMAATASWYLQQSVNDVAVISRGTSAETFLLMPDGSYQTPAPSGESLTYKYNVYTWKSPQGDSEIFPANGGGITTAATPGNAVTTSFTYKTYGTNSLLSAVATAPSPHVLTFSYSNISGEYLLSKVTDETNRSVAFNYSPETNQTNTFSDLLSITLVDNTSQNPRTLTMGYIAGINTGDFWPQVGSAVLLKSVTDSLNYVVQVYYDSRYMAGLITNPNNHTTSYFTAGNRTEVDDAVGNTSYSLTYPVRGFGDFLETDSYDSLNNETSTLTNYVGQTIWKKLPLSEINGDYKYNYTYDARGNLTSTSIGPPGSSQITTSTTWDSNWNKPDQVTDANGKITTYYYDPTYGYLTQILQPQVPCSDAIPMQPICGNGNGYDTPTTKFAYWPDLQIKTITSADGIVTSYAYDTSATTGNLVQVVVDSGNSQHQNLTTTRGYDSVGNVNSVTTPNLNSFTATYDLARRLTSKTNPPLPAQNNAQFTTTYTYDADGDRTAIQQATGGTVSGSPEYLTTTYTYWAPGQVKTATTPAKTAGGPASQPNSLITPGSLTTSYSYDADERLSVTIDPASQYTKQTYDADSRPWQVLKGSSSSLQVTQTTTYTADSLTYQVSDGDATQGSTAHTTTYGYDNFDRLNTTTYADGTYEQFTLDNDGRTAAFLDRSGNSFSYTRDALGHELSETDVPAAAGQSNYAKYFSYDSAGLLRTVDDSVGYFLFGYDTAARQVGLAATIANGSGGTFKYGVNWAYDSDGNTTNVYYPDGYAYNYAFDPIDELTAVTETAPGASTATPLVSYQWTSLGTPYQAAYNNGASTTYSAYDPAEQVTQITYAFTGTGNTGITIGYSRDQDERRQQDQVSNGNFVWHPSSGGTVPYTPDVKGLNQYADINGQALAYNGNGGLTSDASAPLGTATYTWDIFNRLTSASNSQNSATYAYDGLGRRVSKTVNAVTTLFVYDGTHIIAEYAPNGNESRHYIYGVGNAPFLEETFNSNTHTINGSNYLHPDALGTTVAQTTPTGAVGIAFKTSPWGEVSGTNGVPFRFAGMYLDTETMLYYDNARYYSPQQGRFISPDPIGLNGGVNIYAYSENDPINDIDLTGLDDCSSQPPCYTLFGGTGGDDAWSLAHTFYQYLFGDGSSITYDGNGNYVGSEGGPDSWTPSPAGAPPSSPDYYLRVTDPANEFNGAIFPLDTAGEPRLGDGGFGFFAALAAAPLTGGASLEAEEGIALFGSAAAEGGAARGLEGAGQFFAETNAAGGTVYTSEGAIYQSDVGAIVSKALSGGDVNILTGVHGFADGSTIAEESFYTSDLAKFGNIPGVNVYNINNLSNSEITNMLNGPGTTIGAFCNSSVCLAPLR